MITNVKGNIFETEAKIIAHGVNCQGAFGYGVAGQIRIKYPKAANEYFQKYKKDGWKLGEAQFVSDSNKIIANLATQEFYGNAYKNKKIYVSYLAVEKSLKNLKHFAKENNYSIAIPKIGAGLAGGDWNQIEQIIKKVFNDYPITIYSLD